ncbi:MAG: hypothetical protein WCV71_00520 [Patescibacteria group bacterium]
MLRILSCAMLLLTIVSICGAQVPEGGLYKLADGSGEYIVDDADRLGQWQVAFGEKSLWAELVKSNPQLADPDMIIPGDKLIIPASLVRLFEFRRASLDAMVPTIPADTTVSPLPTTQAERSTAPALVRWMMAITVIMAVFTLAYLLGKGIQRAQHADAEDNRRQNEIEEGYLRQMADPYSGPDQAPGGILTAQTAAEHFARQYEVERNAMTVAESTKLPGQVSIDRIEAVDVRGPMVVSYAGGLSQQKNIPDWQPAWRCYLSDGTSSLTLMRCGNDVRVGTRTTTSEGGEIRLRQDIDPVDVDQQIWPPVDLNQQIWPPVVDQEPTLPVAEIAPEPGQYREIRVQSASRLVLLRRDGSQELLDMTLLGDLVAISIVAGKLVAQTSDHRRIIGEVNGD